MGENGSSWLPNPSSTFAGDVDKLFNFVALASAILFVGVVVSIIYFVIKYRRRSDSEVPVPEHESRLLEWATIILPTILVMIVFTWGFRVFVTLSTAPPDSYEVIVRGKQWFWEFEYPNGIVNANELYVPVGQPVRLKMSSADVIHSFFVPEFRIKHDVLPNRYSTVWFEAKEPGEYQIYCTEYCGTQHSAMLGKVVAVPQSEFDSWLEQQNQDLPPVELGAKLFQQYSCNACHSTTGATLVGPPLNGIMGRQVTFTDGASLTVDEDYIRESIVNPGVRVVEGFNPVMPPTFGSMSARQIDGLIAYIKSLE
jgi:cytochrome c oxidase subunit 2